MPTKRLSMRKIKEVLRLSASKMSNRKIAACCSISRPTVADYHPGIAEICIPYPP